MSKMKNEIVNLNSVRLRDLEAFLRDEISKCDPENKIVSFAIADTDEFALAYADLQKSPRGSQLLLIEDEFNLAFENVLAHLDSILNIFIDDSYENFSSVDLSFEEGLMLMPDFAAAEKLLPHDSEGTTIFDTLGYSTGHVWSPKDISLLLLHLQKKQNRKHIVELGMEEEIETLLHIYRSEQKFIIDNDLKGELLFLRKCRSKLGTVYPLIVNFIDPKANTLNKSRLIDVRDIINPILEAEYEKRIMEEFSFNDFSHDSFLLMAERFIDQFQDDGSNFDKTLIERLGEYRETVSPVKNHSLWELYQKHESVWYHDVEQLFLTMNFAYGSIDANDPIRWKAHTETPRYQSAEALWDILDHSVFDALFFFRRGSFIRGKQWEMMKDLYTDTLQQAQLDDIGALHMFNRALNADSEALKIMEQIVEESDIGFSCKEIHNLIHEKRYNLNAALNWAGNLMERGNHS